jgi:hypothetical protein
MTDFSLILEDRPGYLHSRVTGTNSQDNVLGYTQKIHEACVARKCTAVLIEENLTGPSVSLATAFELVDARVPQARQTLTRIAYVDINPEHDFWRMEFAVERAAKGGVDVRLFKTVEAAQRWLEPSD